MNPWWMVALGGAGGSVLRYGVSRLMQGLNYGVFPWPTFAVNLTGCFLIGWMYAWLNRNGHSDWAPMLIAGFLGGFTTFSAFGYEALQFIRTQEYQILLIYAGGSVALGILLVAAGYWLGS
jgi:CrcB protein